ncbi:MAG: response regulator [Deltaproteobacteria bacterium]|nr:response regulator [Deltaproteobacteria bacterium]
MSFNVLIVDDSSSMRAVIKKVIAISGFKMNNCYEAGNGIEALERLKENWVDAIISDINMPEMNGLELLKELQRDSLYKNIPVIVVSTEGSSERMNDALQAGAKGFIKKPFLPEDIRKVLYDVIGVGSDGEYQEDRRDAEEVDF